MLGETLEIAGHDACLGDGVEARPHDEGSLDRPAVNVPLAVTDAAGDLDVVPGHPEGDHSDERGRLHGIEQFLLRLAALTGLMPNSGAQMSAISGV